MSTAQPYLQQPQFMDLSAQDGFQIAHILLLTSSITCVPTRVTCVLCFKILIVAVTILFKALLQGAMHGN